MTRTLAPFASPSPTKLLSRILEEPALVSAIQRLPARALGKLVAHVGLEDCGEIVALATTEQLARVFDDDLWRSERPGRDETFDAERMLLWLEVMLEAGETFAAAKVAELPEDLVTLALHRRLLVLDQDQLGVEMAALEETDSDLIDKTLDGCATFELGEYLIVARRSEGWDALAALLTALDRDHHELVRRQLGRCCQLSAEVIADNGGLYQVLTSEQMLEEDLAAEREERRAGEGYIAPSAAASFLATARGSALETIKAGEVDPITRIYFRGFAPGGKKKARGPAATTGQAPQGQAGDAGVDRLATLLRDAKVLSPSERKLLSAGEPARVKRETPFRRMLREIGEAQPARLERVMAELAYLANVLVAGCAFRGRSFRPVEAAEAVMATCNLGLELAREKRPDLAKDGAVGLFRVGWHALHHQIVREAGRTLERVLLAHRHQDRAREVRDALLAGKPWEAQDALEALDDTLAEGALASLSALLGECPSLATRNARLTPVFIATRAQLERARAFLARLAPKGNRSLPHHV